MAQSNSTPEGRPSLLNLSGQGYEPGSSAAGPVTPTGYLDRAADVFDHIESDIRLRSLERLVALPPGPLRDYELALHTLAWAFMDSGKGPNVDIARDQLISAARRYFLPA